MVWVGWIDNPKVSGVEGKPAGVVLPQNLQAYNITIIDNV
jgi:hypothetical protein